jgi:dTMP kinase
MKMNFVMIYNKINKGIKMLTKSLFITFEGIDGTGKSTQLKLTSDFLKENEIDHIVTREPGGTKISEKIRNIILDNENKEMSICTELLLYLAARAQHVKEVIMPAIENNKIILCDRFHFSTFAYQSFARGLNLKILENLNDFSTNFLKPDLIFILDMSLQTAKQRLLMTNKSKDRLENENEDFFNKAKDGFLKLAEKDLNKSIFILNAEENEQQISNKIQKIILDHLN